MWSLRVNQAMILKNGIAFPRTRQMFQTHLTKVSFHYRKRRCDHQKENRKLVNLLQKFNNLLLLNLDFQKI